MFFIVEMQKAPQNYFKDRSVFYSTFPIQQQAKTGKWDYNLKHVYTIGLLDFEFDEHKNEPRKFIHKVKLSDIETHKVFYDKLTYIYIELPKFRKDEKQLKTMFDRCSSAFRSSPRYLDCRALPPWAVPPNIDSEKSVWDCSPEYAE